MPARRASPTPSEGEVDILESLYPGDGSNRGKHDASGMDFDFDGLMNARDAANDDDEAFIALQQAASFRKNTNLKGRTVKKGGGFQAMGNYTWQPEGNKHS